MSARDDYPRTAAAVREFGTKGNEADRMLDEIDCLRNEVANCQAFVQQVRQAMFLVES